MGVLEETEGAGAVELKDGVTGTDEVRWLAGGRCDLGQCSGSQTQRAKARIGRWADGKTGWARWAR